MSEQLAGATTSVTTPWWLRPGLETRRGRLVIAGRDAEELGRREGTPRYVFDLSRIGEQVRSLQGALSEAGLVYRIRFALKACREPEVLACLHGLGAPGSPTAVGIDACSPGELRLALSSGWSPEEISLTGTNMSDSDFRSVLDESVHVNVDLLSQLRRLGRLSRGRKVGLRVNPKVSAVRGGENLYSGQAPTKFGIFPEDLERAAQIAHTHALSIVALHIHIGWEYLDAELPAFERAVETLAQMTLQMRGAGFPILEVNVGGGLGVPLGAGERALDLPRWARILARHLGPLGVVVAVEPGEFLVREAAVLLAEVVSVEERLGKTFVGLNVGWNAIQQSFVYDEPVELALCRAPLGQPVSPVTFSGNINEGPDIFATDHPFPPVEEGDIVAMLKVGAYNQATANDHCLRPRASATYFEDRI